MHAVSRTMAALLALFPLLACGESAQEEQPKSFLCGQERCVQREQFCEKVQGMMPDTPASETCKPIGEICPDGVPFAGDYPDLCACPGADINSNDNVYSCRFGEASSGGWAFTVTLRRPPMMR